MKSIYTKSYKMVLKKLKKARKGAGLRQQDVAKKLKKPQSYVSKIENGERRLDIIELEALAKLYKTDIKNFLG